MLKIKTTKDGENYVTLDYQILRIREDGVLTFVGDYRQISDIIIKFCFNTIFLNISDMYLMKKMGVWVLEITPINKFEITKEGELK